MTCLYAHARYTEALAVMVTNDNKMCDLISYINDKCVGDKVFCGDFSYPHISWDTWSTRHECSSARKFINCLQKNFLQQLVDCPTRYREDDVPHTLDLVIASCNFVENINYLPPLGNSDHSILYFTCDRYAIYKPLVEKFCLSEGRYDELRLLIKMH